MKFKVIYQEHKYPGNDNILSVSFFITENDRAIVHACVDWQDDLRIAQVENVSLEEWDVLSKMIGECYLECINRLGDQWKIGHAIPLT